MMKRERIGMWIIAFDRGLRCRNEKFRGIGEVPG